MIITLSPAKVLDFKSPVSIKASSTPIYKDEAGELNNLLKNLSKEEIASLMKINPVQTLEIYQHIHTFDLKNRIKRQAIFAYNGIAFQGLSAKTLSEEDLYYAQEHLVILSGLYGALRPLDMIKPYRLEMQASLNNKKGKTLYDYWSVKLTQYINKLMKANGKVWVNLASNEYSKVINRKLLAKGSRIITPVFKQYDGNSYKQVVVYAKKARGMMARFIIENRLTDTEHIKAFNEDGYTFSEQLSSEKEWIFIR